MDEQLNPNDPTLTLTELSEDGATQALLDRVERESGVTPKRSPLSAWMRAAAHACRAELAERMNQTLRSDRKSGAKRVHYLSMEFLMGRALSNALAALGLEAAFKRAAESAGHQPRDVLEREPDAALGNGGLGRLAACFLDSMATLELPSFGYGLRYEYGMFDQHIHDGAQTEEPSDWLRDGNPWELHRPEIHFRVGFGGRVVSEGQDRRWEPGETLHATAYDFVVPGYATRRVAVLRLWQAAPSRPIDFAAFSRGDYASAGAAKQAAETINWVLYPDDSTPAGRELRLRQEYFLVSASLQDLIARHIADHGRLTNLGEKAAIHLNDTHPALTVPELLRLLIDEHGMTWEAALEQCQRALSYTNHTLMPEALETWPVRMLEDLLPRHLELIYQLNAHFLGHVTRHFPDDNELIARVSLIDEQGERRVRMAPLSIVASHQVNGVSKLHSDLMVETIFADYAQILPRRFCNVTNGVTPRRWLAQANPELSTLLDRRLAGGHDWRTHLERLAELRPLADDAEFRAEILAAKLSNKQRLAELVRRELGLIIDPDSLIDVHIKRIHEYKRQLLNILQVIARYQAISAAPEADWQPRTVLFAGKAASAYHKAKLIIRLIHDVARVVNSDPRIDGRLRVVFLPNYGVSAAEVIIPAADLSEQISTAGTEASGTGNMKFAMNGAMTIGTWDGANIEMAEAVGRDHFFIFGHDADEVRELRNEGYNPRAYVEDNPRLFKVLEAIASGAFSPADHARYRGLVDNLLNRDSYLLLADFAAYLEAQARVDMLFGQRERWAGETIHNIAGMGYFSTDRTIRDYAENIWGMPVPTREPDA
ncbi:glycogen/starch/alpha-glucan phosphorylase [Pseudenhygromyxa sp. WMMC2535]|uniref:glycogen/starch/alpha-glucan phosphorylase n=1 Tax=Pseudenhygromyxa sp. WMMC2535 TaxID=2712867 RepID=UPI001551BE63|nr:glycogen/starch/alpha-glucan phosphorylase [Pseudenhygromyxa sp. WMMC2535]NVB36740.1 glycogen/starch/alpha-glucan phosphorylase [Pseudenhygromyxa sp. WMMC2535]